MDEMKTNVTRLNDLQQLLEAAQDELDGLNKEEELLEWEASEFPIITAMFASKQPYDQLWNTALNFHTKYETWLNGMYSSGGFLAE